MPGPQEIIHTLRAPSAADQQGGVGLPPQVTININFYGYQQPPASSDYVAPEDWETTEFEAPDENPEESMSEGDETGFNPEVTE